MPCSSANSGHPGMPMGMADLAVVLWSQFLRSIRPTLGGRTATVSCFRTATARCSCTRCFISLGFPSRWTISGTSASGDRRRPATPSRTRSSGSRSTTGPLGQGFGTGVGMAIAEAHLRSVFGAELVDHHIYGFVSDGDLMEGVSSEAASLAGHLALGKIVYLYDDNQITIDGSTDLAFSEGVAARFDAYGWHTLSVDGHDRAAIEEAVATAVGVENRPSLISLRRTSVTAPRTSRTRRRHTARRSGTTRSSPPRRPWAGTLPPFEVPDEVYGFFAAAVARGHDARRTWEERRDAAFAQNDGLAARWQSYCDPKPVTLTVPEYEPGTSVATRQLSGDVIQELSQVRPDVVGGSADLTPSNNTIIAEWGRLLGLGPQRAQHPVRRPRARDGRHASTASPSTAACAATERRSSSSPTTCGARSGSGR